MKKINEALHDFSIKGNLKDSLRDEYIKALKDETFKELVSTISLKEDDLMKYTSKLQEASVEYGNCKKCKGLVECKNPVTGFALTPYASEHHISFSYDICRYQEALRIQNKYQDNAFYFDVPKEIRDARMSEIYTSDKKRVEIITWLKEFANTYKKDMKGKGLYLSGSFGSGKTYIIAALFNELAKKGEKVAIIYWPEFLRTLKASFATDFDDKYEYIKKIPFLLIDDIGAENLTAWARDEILGPILQFRMQEELSTFFTSNLSTAELENHFSITTNRVEKLKAKRIMERINQLSTEMTLISKNNRK
ncbi:MAG: primosomal protein DnaI [Bacilli bacterium]|nr:primosomal protein DnaI [Bacilli bacterium]